MILDSSAIVAMVLREPAYKSMLAKVGAARTLGVGAHTLVETAIVLSARLATDAQGLVARFLQEADTSIIPFGEAHHPAAHQAWLRFGKGRHPAALNFADCLTYATARLAGEPLLCTGSDFAQTDLELA